MVLDGGLPHGVCSGHSGHGGGHGGGYVGDGNYMSKFKKNNCQIRTVRFYVKGQGWVTAEYAMLPRATQERTSRRAGGRDMEIQRLIGRSLRAVVDRGAIGERTITVDCDVLQADGGTRTAAITGAYVALADACRWLEERGKIDRSPIHGQVAAVSVGIFGTTPVLDLDYAEDSNADTDMNVVMNARGGLIEVQGTAEGAAFNRAELDALQGRLP